MDKLTARTEGKLLTFKQNKQKARLLRYDEVADQLWFAQIETVTVQETDQPWKYREQ